ncbi:MAG: FAD-dependent oxidoreductase [Candidatus Gastranaerophilales bacterium]
MSIDLENNKNKIDVLVVGGGPAGISAAVTIARAGKKVALIERGKFSGSKNVFGGVIYAQPTREIFPDFEATAPLERKTVEHKYALLGKSDGTIISYKKRHDDPVSYTVIRSKFDRWLADEAKKEGVILVEETLVKELIVKNDCVVGIKTELEEYFADLVILADGVNSLLAKQIGLREKIEPQDVALSVKEVFKLPVEKINDRLLVNSDESCTYEIFGGPMLNMLGLGFVYANKNSISIGLGITMDEFVDKKCKPHELLNELKAHPVIAPLIKDGELLEYSAHLIPEGGYKKMPKLFANGVMVCGDAAMMVNNLHWEGTNLAMVSGKLAGETAIFAIEQQDFSEELLSMYKMKLDKSFVMKDLYTYRDLMNGIHARKDEFLGYYPQKINEFFEMFTSVDSEPKKNKYWKFIKSIFTDRKISTLCKDGVGIIKILWSMLR